MRLESALYASSAGLEAHGDAMSVIGDNVSNANTTAFKSGVVQFADLLAEGPEERKSSAKEVVGNGVIVSQVRQDHQAGAVEVTGRSLDVALDGEGFFIVGGAADPSFTRAGSFIIDEAGLLSTAAGKNVLGFVEGSNTLQTIDMLSLNVSGTPSSLITISGNLGSQFPITDLPGAPATFQEIGANANFVTSASAFDTLGIGHDVTVAFYKTGATQWTARAFIDGGDVTGGTAGVPLQLGADAVLNFNTSGIIEDANLATAQITATPAYANGAAQGAFTMDLSSFTQFGGTSVTSTITQDGQGTGDIADYEINADGQIFAQLSSGAKQLIGTLAVANFNNEEGLVRVGSSLFVDSDRSGDAIIGTAGTAGVGEIEGGALELSNVDLADQFVDLVIYQRGYSASSQIFQATGDIMRDTINLIR
ncbi:MAG: flagellar hook protein FlgE [Bdellovibrionales bacterium]|nr:flagellar hook protein FlgE [Bdellovibrionales bacterium]